MEQLLAPTPMISLHFAYSKAGDFQHILQPVWPCVVNISIVADLELPQNLYETQKKGNYDQKSLHLCYWQSTCT